MNGILVIDKPVGITSHDVVARVRRILKTKRVGHTGTLDPFATGVMVILVGQATRLAQFLDKDEKEYLALMRLGFETDSGDRTGKRIEGETLGRRDAVTDEEIKAVLSEFRGEIEQVPPMFSAKKIDGKRLYELARKGETIERRSVRVNISEIELSEPPALAGGRRRSDFTTQRGEIHVDSGAAVTPPAYAGGSDRWFADAGGSVSLRVVCSAGTYVRTLAVEIGRRLGTGAHLGELRRTRAGKFGIDQSTTLDDLSQQSETARLLIPIDQAVEHLARIELTEERVAKTRSGLSSRIGESGLQDGEAAAMFDTNGNLVAVGRYDAAENSIHPKVVLV